MANKTRWQNDQPAFDNPFAALKKPENQTQDAPVISDIAPTKAALRLPKVKSARLERADRGGKTVTRVFFHGQPGDDEIRAWLKSTKTKLGIGGSIDEKGVFLQGDQIGRLKDAAMLP